MLEPLRFVKAHQSVCRHCLVLRRSKIHGFNLSSELVGLTSVWNWHISKTVTLAMLRWYLKGNDQLITVDIKNGYPHFKVKIENRDYLGIYFDGTFYRWCMLLFLLSLAAASMWGVVAYLRGDVCAPCYVHGQDATEPGLHIWPAMLATGRRYMERQSLLYFHSRLSDIHRR